MDGYGTFCGIASYVSTLWAGVRWRFLDFMMKDCRLCLHKEKTERNSFRCFRLLGVGLRLGLCLEHTGTFEGRVASVSGPEWN